MCNDMVAAAALAGRSKPSAKCQSLPEVGRFVGLLALQLDTESWKPWRLFNVFGLPIMPSCIDLHLLKSAFSPQLLTAVRTTVCTGI